ncbi:DUF2244 domain-containing protein [Devosia aurantiaca]|uniref:DUF2244 domain-containing protein n=1 Tax=Devosia aurantiaca TaxID=2714858 RepID=A0A6M1SUX3_9HYPH|nr:DUF2244 domain-containing protein [Devosia aurantiaca]NGP16741.1 DUF2244 domain-containing protein [Devosia aurantiaca]
MTAPTQATSTTPLFSATLKPERSLHAAGGWVGLVLAGIVGTPFLIAMPEFLFPGLAAFGLAGGGLGALGIRQGRLKRQSQAISVWPDQLELVITGPGQQKQLRRFDSKAIRIRLVRDGYERTTAIFLRHAEEEVELGGFLSVDDKSSFAKAFGSALRQARRSI